MSRSSRQSNIELCRIVCMLLIISFHYVYKGGYDYTEFTLNTFILKTFWMFGELGVNVFILITGYFMINGKFKWKKLLMIYLEVLFYHFFSFAIAFALKIYSFPSEKDFFLWFFPHIAGWYWFTAAYILLYILSPFLNKFANALSQKEYKEFLIIVLSIWCVIPTIFGFFNNNSESMLNYTRLLWLIIVYLVGAYIRLYPIKLFDSLKKSLFMSAVSFISLMLSIVFIWIFNDIFAQIGTTEVAYFWRPNTILMFLMSVSFFHVFLNIKISNNKIINKLASTTLGTYILHDGVLQIYLWVYVFKNASHQNSKFLVIHIIGAAVIIFMVGALIDIIRQYFEKKIFKGFMINFKKE